MKTDEILIIGAVGFGAWYFFLRPKTVAPSTGVAVNPTTGLPYVNTGLATSPLSQNGLTTISQTLLGLAPIVSTLINQPKTPSPAISPITQQQLNTLFPTSPTVPITTGIPATTSIPNAPISQVAPVSTYGSSSGFSLSQPSTNFGLSNNLFSSNTPAPSSSNNFGLSNDLFPEESEESDDMFSFLDT